MRAGTEVPTDMSWCNPVPVFVPGPPSLVTGHTVTMGQRTIGDWRPGLTRIITQEHRSGVRYCQLLASQGTLSKLGRGKKLGTENI